MTEQAKGLDKAALRRIIESTVVAAGEPDPSTLPHLIRQRLEGQATGELDLDQYIQQVLREMKKA
ncbi:hypothetical protein HK107_00555 [Parvularcula sp. ZS-1/3]|uniref:Antitoxin VbhA domain-containing protein n=1 Tax=Parvularcula mediterranea TaxID=2732508 RepID=A0A7Y3W3J2_9PROT|nr:hypothetical protein [Parvularcula mediterranea]NNU14810.1 hypothetical protein [Parvularcula mediterranea]